VEHRDRRPRARVVSGAVDIIVASRSHLVVRIDVLEMVVYSKR